MTKGFVEVRPSGTRGISLVSLTASEIAESDLADLREMSPEVAGSRSEDPPAPSAGPKSKGGSSGLVGEERVTSEVVLRISASERGDLTNRVQEVKPGTAYFMKRRPQEKEKVKYTSQVRSLLRPAGNAALSVTDASTSE